MSFVLLPRVKLPATLQDLADCGKRFRLCCSLQAEVSATGGFHCGEGVCEVTCSASRNRGTPNSVDQDSRSCSDIVTVYWITEGLARFRKFFDSSVVDH